MASKLAVAIIVLVAAAALVVATNSASPVQAQCDDEFLPCVDNSLPPLADLSITISYSPTVSLTWDLTVQNNRVGKHPETTARTVLVRIIERNADGDDVAEMWTIRDLRPGASVTETRRPDAVGPHRIRAEIIRTDPVEPPGSQHNNKTEDWAWGLAFTNGDAGVGVSITGSDRFPKAGGATTFMVHAVNHSWSGYEGVPGGTYQDRQVDVQVRITPSSGLALSSAQQAPTGTTFDPSTGTWDVGTIESLAHTTLPVAVNLTGDSLEELPLEERCLTAEVTQATPWFALHNHKRANDTTTVCLGEDRVLITSGEFTLFDFRPCVGVSAHPCTNADTLELLMQAVRHPVVVVNTINMWNFDRIDDQSTVTRGSTWLQPGELVLRIEDDPEFHETRKKDDSGKVFWSTKGPFTLKDSQADLPDSIWSSAREDLTVTGLNGGPLPGTFTMAFPDEPDLDVEITDATKAIGDSFDTGYDIETILKLGNLGTYVLTFDIQATHITAGVKKDSGTYTFHVGPVVELDVQDAGSSPQLSAHQQAYRIMALNNGPDNAPAARVLLSGVPRGAEAIPSEGSYTQRCSGDSCTGTWTIGELGYRESRRASGLTEGPILTLVANDLWTDSIEASIKNTQDYSVCIDSDGDDVDADTQSVCEATTGNSWHSTEYYDYIPDNNEATIHARAGTGTGHPEAPTELKVLDALFANVLLWKPVKTVNGHTVAHYEIERSTGTWERVAGEHQGTIYIDLDNPAQAQYRVRAVNIFGVPGPWSAPAPGALPVPSLDVVSVEPDGIRLTWSPVVGDVLVKAYEIEFSYDGESFRRLTVVPGGASRFYTHTDAAPNRDVYYRVRAIPVEGEPSPWSEVAVARVPLGSVGGFRAQANGPSEIVLEWTKADIRGAQFSDYEIEESQDGEDWFVIANLYELEETTFVVSSLDSGATHYFRIRANTLHKGEWLRGEWSQVVRATTDSGGPEYGPTNLTATASVDDRGRHYITLAWGQVEVGNITYRIEFSTDGENWELLRDRYLTRTYNHTNLSPGVEYRYRVAARNLRGRGPFSDEASATTGDPADPPGKPLNMRFTDVSQSQATFTWEAPEDDGGSLVTGYEYMYYAPCGSDAEATCESGVKSTRSTRATVSGLTVPGTYQFVVRAVNAVGPGDWTEGIFTTISPEARGKVTVSPTAFTIGIGESKTFRVKLGSSPTWPVAVYLAWGLEDDPLLDSLEWQQGRILLPSSWAKPTEGDPWYDFAYQWNEGIPITVTVAEHANPGEIKGVEALIQCDVIHVPEKDLEEYLGEPVENWEPDPAYDGMACPSIRVTGE